MLTTAGITASSSVSSLYAPSPLRQAAQEPAASTLQAGASAPAAQGGSIWRDVGQRYDVTNMNLSEMDAMTMELYQAGAITLLDRAVLTLDPTQMSVNGQALSEQTIRLTQADASGRRDWIAELEAQKEQALARGETQNASMDERLLGVLRHVQAGSGAGVNLEV